MDALKLFRWIKETWRQRHDEELLFEYKLTKRQLSTWRTQMLQPLGMAYDNPSIALSKHRIYGEVYEMERKLHRLKKQMSNRALSEVIQEELSK